MSEVLPLSFVKAHLSEPIDRVEAQQHRVIATRDGKSAAVLIRTDDLDSSDETPAIPY
jgi:prevent-host-death family protein